MNGNDAGTLADLPAQIRTRLLAGEGDPVFQLLPPLEERDRDALRESVAERGIRVPVEIDPEGRVLDGHHRLEVAAELELDPGEIPVTVRDDLQGEEDVLEYVLEVNLGRRHLTREGRRTIAAELRRRGWSLRCIADRVGVSHETIRRDLKGVTNVTGEKDPDPPATVEGADGKRYPANRDPPSSAGDRSNGRRRSPGPVQERSGRSPPGFRNRSGRGRRRRERESSTSGVDKGGSEPERDPRLELLDRADRLLTKARQRTPEEEAGVREELEALANRVNALQRRIAGTGNVWRPS